MLKLYFNKISIYIIVGMGESYEDIYNLYIYLKENDVMISLFVFILVRGIKMEKIS